MTAHWGYHGSKVMDIPFVDFTDEIQYISNITLYEHLILCLIFYTVSRNSKSDTEFEHRETFSLITTDISTVDNIKEWRKTNTCVIYRSNTNYSELPLH
jgi:hypothetical protein